jgi:hypothetical protein
MAQRVGSTALRNSMIEASQVRFMTPHGVRRIAGSIRSLRCPHSDSRAILICASQPELVTDTILNQSAVISRFPPW